VNVRLSCSGFGPVHRTLDVTARTDRRARHQIAEVAFRKPDLEDPHSHLNTVDTLLNQPAKKTLCPGNTALGKINTRLH